MLDIKIIRENRGLVKKKIKKKKKKKKKTLHISQ